MPFAATGGNSAMVEALKSAISGELEGCYPVAIMDIEKTVFDLPVTEMIF